jgi:hypothetical protein
MLRAMPELRALAALIGHPKLQRTPEPVDALERFLPQPTNLKSQLETMNELEHAAVAEPPASPTAGSSPEGPSQVRPAARARPGITPRAVLPRPARRVTDRPMLRLCEAGKLRCSDKTRRPTAATVQLVAESLADEEFYLGVHGPVASFAWPLLLQAGGLAELAGTRLRLTSHGRAALGAPAHETLRRLWRSWRKHVLDEFNRVDQIKGQANRVR